MKERGEKMERVERKDQIRRVQCKKREEGELI